MSVTRAEVLFAIALSGFVFQFSTLNDIIQFISSLFEHCTEARKELYDNLVASNLQELLDRIEEETPKAEKEQIIRTLRLLHSMYGQIYDPDNLLLSIEQIRSDV